MALYCIGDIQGCDAALGRLFDLIDFSPSRDTVYLLGDLVNRGPDSLGVLRRLSALGNAAQCLLGNHDLHLLAAAHGVRPLKQQDTLQAVLAAPDHLALLAWLRQQKLARLAHGVLMVHAGVLPAWTVQRTLALAGEVEAVLQSPALPEFLREMYGNAPDHWDDSLGGMARLRVIVNVLTRLRFCTAQGVMEFDSKEGTGTAPAGFMPWFDVPARQTGSTPIAFGHWSTLGLINQPALMALDTGCVWGGCLSAVNLSTRELRQTPCEQAQQPG
jgi:bis(5'-nucleosyl)-tetraphosphatase (symmetrical)